MKHTLFVVHGMGRHTGSDWLDEVWKKLVECSERYPHFANRKLEHYVELVPLGYDAEMVTALQRWDRNATDFKGFASAQNLRFANDLDWLTGISDDDAGFLLSHVTDVIIHRFFEWDSERIRTKLQTDIVTEVDRKRGVEANARFSVMGHSLGTSVIHDALAELGTATHIDQNVNSHGVKNLRFDSIHMLANVSRILQTKPKAYESVVRPGPRNAQDRYCLRMYSHRHELDPFTLPKPFEPVSWGGAFRSTRLRHYRGWNIHGWLHYLDHPRVHIPILRAVSKSSAITPHQQREAENNYPRFGGDLENLAVEQAKIAKIHEAVQSIDDDKGLAENYKALMHTWKLLSELKDVAGDTWKKLEGSVA